MVHVNDVQARPEAPSGSAGDARRGEFLAAARALAHDHGIEALTVKALARRMGVSVGSLYNSFRSKDALVAAVQADAIARLGAAYDRAAPGIEPLVADLGEEERALARLVGFGRFVIAARERMPEELRLQQRLLTTTIPIDESEVGVVIPVAFDMLSRPQGLLEAAVAVGALAPGDAMDRTVSWVAAVNGVLLLDGIQWPDVAPFESGAMADRLSLDLLTAWGAAPAALERAAVRVPLGTVTDLFTPVPILETELHP